MRKSLRGCVVTRPLPPLPTPAAPKPIAIVSLYRSIDTAIDDAVFTASPRSNQKARSPSGPRSSWSASTALSMTATDTSARTPLPLLSVTLTS